MKHAPTSKLVSGPWWTPSGVSTARPPDASATAAKAAAGANTARLQQSVRVTVSANLPLRCRTQAVDCSAAPGRRMRRRRLRQVPRPAPTRRACSESDVGLSPQSIRVSIAASDSTARPPHGNGLERRGRRQWRACNEMLPQSIRRAASISFSISRRPPAGRTHTQRACRNHRLMSAASPALSEQQMESL